MTALDDPSGSLLAESAHQAGAVVAPMPLDRAEVSIVFALPLATAAALAVANELADYVTLTHDAEAPVVVTVKEAGQ